MADLKALCEEMKKLRKQIDTILYISGHRDYDDLSGLDDYKQIKTADQRQQLEEYRNILCKLDEVQSDLAYFEKPIREVSRIYTNASGIEFLRTEEVYNYDTEEWENAEIWTCSRVESKDGKYYIVGYPDVEMSGLTVRIRG